MPPQPGYLRHLFMAGEMLGPILLSIHNVTYYQRLVADARRAIEIDRFEEFRRERLAGWAARPSNNGPVVAWRTRASSIAVHAETVSRAAVWPRSDCRSTPLVACRATI